MFSDSSAAESLAQAVGNWEGLGEDRYVRRVITGLLQEARYTKDLDQKSSSVVGKKRREIKR